MSYTGNVVTDLEVIRAGIMSQLKRDMDFAILHNPWIWSPDPLIHSVRWVQRQRPITVRRWRDVTPRPLYLPYKPVPVSITELPKFIRDRIPLLDYVVEIRAEYIKATGLTGLPPFELP